MAIYRYKSISVDGKTHKGMQEATGFEDLKVALKAKSEYLLDASIAKEKRRSNFLTVSNNVPSRVVANFCRQFSILLEAGVSVVDSLDTLRKQNFSTYFKNVISDIYDSVLKGLYLSDAFKKYPKIFKSFFVNMIHIGEISGNLDTVLTKVADYLENDQKTKSKTKSAMTYPIFLLVIILGVVVLLMGFVVPQFEETIISSGGTVPALTAVVLAISRFFTTYWMIILPILAIVIVFLVFFFKKTNTGKYVKNYLAIHLPIFRTITVNMITTRFATAFSILIDSGMPVIESLEGLIPILDNRLFEVKFVYAIEDIKRGRRIAPSIEKCDIFPKMLIEMLDVGEETGSLGKVCETVARYYQTQLDNSVTKATSLLEPVIIVIMGILVGTIILAVLLPIMEMTTSMGGESTVPDISI